MMANFENENNIEWKKELRSEIITAFIEKENQMIYDKIETHYNNGIVQTSLYKYYKDEKRNFENVKSNKIWCSVACNFNDVFDCNISIDEKSFTKSTFQQVNNEELPEGTPYYYVLEKTEKHINNIKSAFKSVIEQMGVSCFSESCQLLLMWAHYANNHCGFCVEYDMVKIVEKYCIGLIPIMYSDKRVTLKSFDIKNMHKDMFKLFIKSASSKSKEWNYEKEWRILLPYTVFKKDDWHEKEGGLIDMIPPSSIILGCQATSDFENQVKEYCENSKINLYKMEKDEYEYKLNRKPILEF